MGDEGREVLALASPLVVAQPNARMEDAQVSAAVLTLRIEWGPGRVRRWLLGITAACLILAGCPVWPSSAIAFSRSYWDGLEWVVEWQTWGTTYHVRTPSRDAMRIVDAILWERGRK